MNSVNMQNQPGILIYEYIHIDVSARVQYMTDRTNNVYWRITPKFHLFLHLVEEQTASSGNPKALWCYSDERAIGAAAKLAKSVHPGVFNRRLMQRYRIL